jgi:branched-chain amino acid aminotransferase
MRRRLAKDDRRRRQRLEKKGVKGEVAEGYLDVNGQLLPVDVRHISALDRGFTLGDGVFETVRVIGGRPFRLEAHLTRLRESAAVLELPIPVTPDELAARTEHLLAANERREAVVRLTVSRGVPPERGLLPPLRPEPTVVIQVSPFHELPAAKLAQGFSAHISAIRRNEHSPVARIKACNYLDNVLARMEAQRAGADEAILLNTAGALACLSAANLHLVRGRRVLTPALHCGVLAGITRQVVSELAVAIGLDWEEGWLLPDEIWAAQEAFLTNSVLGVVPITSVDTRSVGTGKPGPISMSLRQALGELG